MEDNDFTLPEEMNGSLSFNKSKGIPKTYDTVEAPGISFGDYADYPDSKRYKEMAGTKCIVLFLFISLGTLAVLGIIFCFIYFN